MTLRIGFGHAHDDVALGAVVAVVQIDGDGGVAVFALHLETAAGAAAPAHVGKQVGKEVAVVGARRFVARTPVRRRPEGLALRTLVAAQFIIGGALFRVAQHAVGLIQGLGALVRVRFLAHVGVVFAYQLAVRLLDLGLGRRLFDAKLIVVVIVFHRACS